MSKMMKCQLCTKYTTDIEADDRNFNSGRCMCGGELKEVMTDYKNELIAALKADFDELYKPQFTTDWESQRFIRRIELDIMSLSNLEALLSQHSKKRELEARLSELKSIVDPSSEYEYDDESRFTVQDRIKQLGGQDE